MSTKYEVQKLWQFHCLYSWLPAARSTYILTKGDLLLQRVRIWVWVMCSRMWFTYLGRGWFEEISGHLRWETEWNNKRQHSWSPRKEELEKFATRSHIYIFCCSVTVYKVMWGRTKFSEPKILMNYQRTNVTNNKLGSYVSLNVNKLDRK
jgi:hypothetical protein